MKFEFNPWQVPNYVTLKVKAGLKQDGMKEVPSFHLSDLEPEDLSKMCDDFREEIFRKAKMEDPRK